MKTVVITGVSKGIGRATADRFLAEGWFVIGTSTRPNVRISSPHFRLVQLDYTDPKSFQKAFKEIKALKKTIDVLVNNAAIFLDTKGERIKKDKLEKTFLVNVAGTIGFTELIEPLIKKGGHIINISSMAASLTDPIEWGWITPAYKISKVAINMYTRVLAEQLKKKNIIVSSLDPGWVKTDMGGRGAERLPAEAADDIYNLAIKDVPSGRFWREGKERGW